MSWAYLLDAIFADAHRRGVTDLHLVVPFETLAEEAEIRASLTPTAGAPQRVGVADLCGAGKPAARDPTYLLRFGQLAPRPLREANGPDVAHAHQHLRVFTRRARLLGVPIRLTSILRRPDLHDRAMFAMRKVFASHEDVPAFYHLFICAERN